jgi:hypothetical protein
MIKYNQITNIIPFKKIFVKNFLNGPGLRREKRKERNRKKEKKDRFALELGESLRENPRKGDRAMEGNRVLGGVKLDPFSRPKLQSFMGKPSE